MLTDCTIGDVLMVHQLSGWVAFVEQTNLGGLELTCLTIRDAAMVH